MPARNFPSLSGPGVRDLPPTWALASTAQPKPSATAPRPGSTASSELSRRGMWTREVVVRTQPRNDEPVAPRRAWAGDRGTDALMVRYIQIDRTLKPFVCLMSGVCRMPRSVSRSLAGGGADAWLEGDDPFHAQLFEAIRSTSRPSSPSLQALAGLMAAADAALEAEGGALEAEAEGGAVPCIEPPVEDEEEEEEDGEGGVAKGDPSPPPIPADEPKSEPEKRPLPEDIVLPASDSLVDLARRVIAMPALGARRASGAAASARPAVVPTLPYSGPAYGPAYGAPWANPHPYHAPPGAYPYPGPTYVDPRRYAEPPPYGFQGPAHGSAPPPVYPMAYRPHPVPAPPAAFAPAPAPPVVQPAAVFAPSPVVVSVPPPPAPMQAPVHAPAPVPVPVTAPVTAPVQTALTAPVAAPVPAPVTAPVPAPVPAAMPAPVTAPVTAPVPAAPVHAPSPVPVLRQVPVDIASYAAQWIPPAARTETGGDATGGFCLWESVLFVLRSCLHAYRGSASMSSFRTAPLFVHSERTIPDP